MPNHGRIDKNLNGDSLSIKGKQVLDSSRNLNVKNLKADSMTFGNRQTVNSGAFSESETDATLHSSSGFIVTPTASTSADSSFNIMLTNNLVTSKSIVFAQVTSYNGAGEPMVSRVVPGNGVATIVVQNVGTASLNQSVTVGFMVV